MTLYPVMNDASAFAFNFHKQAVLQWCVIQDKFKLFFPSRIPVPLDDLQTPDTGGSQQGVLISCDRSFRGSGFLDADIQQSVTSKAILVASCETSPNVPKWSLRDVYTHFGPFFFSSENDSHVWVCVAFPFHVLSAVDRDQKQAPSCC